MRLYTAPACRLRSQQETRRIINESKNPDIRLVADSIATLRALHKQINITPDQWLTQEGSKGYNEASRLAFNIERLEMELLDLTSGERKALNRDITWQSVSAALKPSDAAVEFVISGSYIMALVVRNGSEKPVPVKLCPLKQFSAALESVNAKLGDNGETPVSQRIGSRSVQTFMAAARNSHRKC